MLNTKTDAKMPGSNSLPEGANARLLALTADWQVVADLAGADLVLWLPTVDGRFIASALCRSATSATVHVEDIVGFYSSAGRTEALNEALELGEIVDSDSTDWAGGYSTSSAFVPVPYEGRVVAVVSREVNVSARGGHAAYDMWTEWAGNVMLEMIAEGQYPYDQAPTGGRHGVPRVIDGAILLDADGIVRGLTPNATSCIRRLGIRGHLIGQSLGREVTAVLREGSTVEEMMPVVLTGKGPQRTEVEARGHVVNMRALPLIENGERTGAVIITRDVSEMHKREQELMSKDATIREIHHRVKNNLQTVSALLRMQRRRTNSDEVKVALTEAERRVQAIATVHEALSHNVDEVVDFDRVASEVLRMAGAVATTDHHANVIVEGGFGTLSADAAAALATVLTELVTNSVEHGLADRDGTVWVKATRSGDSLAVLVEDDGVGIEPSTPMTGLGTQIVHMMVTGELHGTIDWGQRDPLNAEAPGTTVTLHLEVTD